MLLEIDNLKVCFRSAFGDLHATRGVSLSIGRGEITGLVGESGSGKSLTALAVLGLLPVNAEIAGGDIRWKGRSLLRGGQPLMETIRGKEISMVFQDPAISLDPLFPIGMQIEEIIRRHLGASHRQARERAAELLSLVGLPSPRQDLHRYPHELSGGMQQRVAIAMAIACEPELLIADEPTTALDTIVQAQILDLLLELQRQLGLSILLISHDLGIVANFCRSVSVMYAGRIVESGPTADLFAAPAHPYLSGLVLTAPSRDSTATRMAGIDGSPPELVRLPPGCPFHPRCPIAIERCRVDDPPLASLAGDRRCACWCTFRPAWPAEGKQKATHD